MLEEEKKTGSNLGFGEDLPSIKDVEISPDNNKEDEKKVDYIKEIIDFGKDLLIIIIIVIFVRTYLVIPFKISGQSMYDSYYDKEFIIVDRFSYLNIPNIKEGKPNRGDVVVFRPGVDKTKEYYIKRIIGLPGDKLKIEETIENGVQIGKVYLFDKITNSYKELKELYLSEENLNFTFNQSSRWAGKTAVYEVPNDSYFVMGDNRQNSTDSRECFHSCFLPNGRGNYIKKSDIIGIVLLDLGYYNWIDEISFKPFSIKFGNFSFSQTDLNIDSHPRWFDSPRKYNYE